MTIRPEPLRFGHHALAVLGAAMMGSTILSLLLTTGLAGAADTRLAGATWLATMAILFWLGVFLVALPVAGIVLSLLFPVTRRRTVAGRWICVVAGATSGIILAPLASANFHGATPAQLGAFALTGAAVAGFYLLIGGRLGRDERVIVESLAPSP